MIRPIAVVLVLAGVSLGTYATLSGSHTDARSAQSASPALAAAPVMVTVVKPSSSTAKADPAKAVPSGELLPRIPVALHAPASPAPSDTMTLTRDIQLQLRRVGCYEGAVNGLWSPTVVRSMKAFTDHVNAVLPVEHPDIILLALVQNHRGTACGVSCPPGQARAEDGRCLPQAVMARAAKMRPPDDADLISTSGPTRAAALRPSTEERATGRRMSLGALTAKPEALFKRSTSRPAYTRVRASVQRAANPNPYGRYPRWAARAFAQF